MGSLIRRPHEAARHRRRRLHRIDRRQAAAGRRHTTSSCSTTSSAATATPSRRAPARGGRPARSRRGRRGAAPRGSTECCTSPRSRSWASRSATPSAITGPTSAARSTCSRRWTQPASPRLVFSSTCAVYGQPDEVPISEPAPTRPENPYGASKLAVDGMIGDFCAAHGLGAVSLRYFNVAGASGDLGEDHEPETHLIPNVLRAATGDRAIVEIFGTDYPTPDGTAIRDYIHIDDLAAAHLLALDGTRAGRAPDLQPRQRQRILGARGDRRRRAASPGARSRRARPDRRPGDPPMLVAASELIRSELGWKPREARARADGRRRLGVRAGAARTATQSRSASAAERSREHLLRGSGGVDRPDPLRIRGPTARGRPRRCARRTPPARARGGPAAPRARLERERPSAGCDRQQQRPVGASGRRIANSLTSRTASIPSSRPPPW